MKLNLDVYTYLVSFISSRGDVLAFGLANKQFYSIAKPEFIYRSIRCKLGNVAVWNHIIANPACASRVRELEIQRENHSVYGLDETERVPLDELECGVNDPEGNPLPIRDVEDAERLLILALHVMVNLESFTWDRWAPVINLGAEIAISKDAPRDILSGEGSEQGRYQEDIWTALRDYTQLRRLQVVDLGRRETLFPYPQPIFHGSIFTLGNLTRFCLKVFYSPPHEDDHQPAVVNGDDSDEEDQLLPARVDITRLKEMLNRCPNLQKLALTIFDYHYFFTRHGHPFTDITPILSTVSMPHLHTLELGGLVVDSETMTSFLNTSQHLRELLAFLPISDPNVPALPFSLGTSPTTSLRDGALPELQIIHLPPELLSPILNALPKPSRIRELRTVLPCHWAAAADEDEPAFVPALAEVWDSGSLDGQDAGEILASKNLVCITREGLPNLTTLGCDIKSVSQIEGLIEVTPNLECFSIYSSSVPRLLSTALPHTAWLPYLSRWTHLTKLGNISLWPVERSEPIAPDKILEIAHEITNACPNLREVPWHTGGYARFVMKGEGDGTVKPNTVAMDGNKCTIYL